MLVLGIETSCDETGAALVKDGVLIGDRTTTQTLHEEFGGVVPELASRAHERLLGAAVSGVMRGCGAAPGDIEAVAVTAGPGLAGSLLVGASFAKGFALARKCRLVAVNHLEGHLWAAELEFGALKPPVLALIVSGGHTILVLVNGLGDYNILGQTRDDAAGEILDKVGRMMGLGFPAGATIDRLALEHMGGHLDLPRPRLADGGRNFSFSGLKTAALYYLRKKFSTNGDIFSLNESDIRAMCAELLNAVGDTLISGIRSGMKYAPINAVIVTGGVASSRYLRPKFEVAAAEFGLPLLIPSPKMCTDNAGMIAYLGWKKLTMGFRSPFNFASNPSVGLAQLDFI